ncbi:MAG: Na+ dependent nucleoside transporter [Flavobacteriaceae bacterium]|nr:Na+ dependent nucleoside transporter [Flavobacteriaceae bacterium]
MDLIDYQGTSFESLTRGLIGMISLLLIAYLISSNRKKIKWKTVLMALSIQIITAIGVMKINLIEKTFEGIGNFFIKILEFAEAGTSMLLGDLNIEKYETSFALQVLPVIIFFSAFASILYYFGIIQKLVRIMAWIFTKLFGISGAESLSVAGNIFLGQTETPLLIKEYLNKMTRSEIFLLMSGGMATVAGSVLGGYIAFLGGGDPVLRLEFAKNLIAASFMAAPGVIAISKIVFPESEKLNMDISVSKDKIGYNILSAISKGTTDGIKMAVNVGAMLLVFLALIALLNGVFSFFGELIGLNSWIIENTPYETFSLEFILGYLFAPLMWLIGIAAEDVSLMGQLLGIKLAANEFVGYTQLASLMDVTNVLHFKYQKSVLMATFMLCGFANLASIGIQVGGIGIIAPEKKKILTELGFKAMIAGAIVSLMSATIAGMIAG